MSKREVEAIVLSWPSREALEEACERHWGPGWQDTVIEHPVQLDSTAEPEAGT